MKLMLNQDQFKRRIFHLTNSFPIELLTSAFVLIYCYHRLRSYDSGAAMGLLDPTLLANSFFQATVAAVVIYFYKSKILASNLATSPSDITQGDVRGYLPCIYGVWPHQYQSGILLVEDGMLRFYAKKATGFAMTKEFCKAKEAKFDSSGIEFNPFTPVFFGQVKTLHLVTPKGIEHIIFPSPKETAEELNGFIKSL